MSEANVTKPETEMVNAPANADAAAGKQIQMDIKTTRARWGFGELNKHARTMFICGSLGAAIGLGNMWKFPNLTFKHGGIAFIIAYLIVLLLAGMPMLILEMTLGQKMQRGSAGSLRGITPRLAGVGWVASFCGFVVCLIYNMLLALTLYYMVVAGSMPWTQASWRDGKRPLPCNTAEGMAMNSAKLYLFMDVVKVVQEESCQPYDDGLDQPMFNTNLVGPMIIMWIICGLVLAKGVKSFQYITAILVPLTFLFLIVLLILYVGINNKVGGQGIGFYIGGQTFPSEEEAPTFSSLFLDAFNQVFFSLSVCVGVMYSFSSHNQIRKPVIRDTFVIGILDFVFSFLSGFIAWGAIGYLTEIKDPSFNETKSIALAMVALPSAASAKAGAAGTGMLVLFYVTLFFTGLTSAAAYVEAFACNIMDQFKVERKIAISVTIVSGILLSLPFCSNFGWILFDLTEHYITSYIVIMVGILQCVSVGWLFEYDSTAARTVQHAKALKYLTCFFWVPILLLGFYANFFFPDNSFIGLLIGIPVTMFAVCMSWKMFRKDVKEEDLEKHGWSSFYHEIIYCGVDKLSMSITSLSDVELKNKKEIIHRHWWMAPFETWFGLSLKFINPACLWFIFCHNLYQDFTSPYADQELRMHLFAMFYVVVALIIIIVPMFLCGY